MYCPQCSQLQSVETMRFCSRCGFPLDGVRALLENKGLVPEAGGDSRTCVKRAIRQAAFVLVIGFFLAALIQVVGRSIGISPSLSQLIALLTVFMAALRIVAAVVYPDKKSKVPERTQVSEISSPSAFAALPNPQTMPISAFDHRAPDTREPLPVPSVTENTTRNL